MCVRARARVCGADGLLRIVETLFQSSSVYTLSGAGTSFFALHETLRFHLLVSTGATL